MNAYGQVARLHSQQWYTDVVHLPVEFPMSADWHRPVSERYRTLSDKEIREGFLSIGKTPELVSGSQVERLRKIINLYDLRLSFQLTRQSLKQRSKSEPTEKLSPSGLLSSIKSFIKRKNKYLYQNFRSVDDFI
ncbi:hypothetical protein [Streptococcus equi]|uniref:hypothetical protein n=1 Tax=Streptococcus equi TaxID=1336 RepID=UPI001E3C7F09|nr:hypothetical protein [Streptococcus equi]